MLRKHNKEMSNAFTYAYREMLIFLKQYVIILNIKGMNVAGVEA